MESMVSRSASRPWPSRRLAVGLVLLGLVAGSALSGPAYARRVFTFVHTSGASETYMAGQSKIYHQITHDEPTDAKLGYQPETSRLAGLVMQGLGTFGGVRADRESKKGSLTIDSAPILPHPDNSFRNESSCRHSS